MLHAKSILAVISCLSLAACGGSKTAGQSGQGEQGYVGQSSTAADLDNELGKDGPAAHDPNAGQLPPEHTGAPYTFTIKNTHTEELVFNLDRGWGGAILAYHGEPPNAVSILPFQKHCTASCDTAGEELCPSCPEPERIQDIRKAQKLEKVAPGATVDIPWDGQVYVYQKTKAGRKRCQCFTKAPAPPQTYSLRACGLRLTSTAEESSKLQCIPNTLTIPSTGPQRIEFDFPAPPEKKKR